MVCRVFEGKPAWDWPKPGAESGQSRLQPVFLPWASVQRTDWTSQRWLTDCRQAVHSNIHTTDIFYKLEDPTRGSRDWSHTQISFYILRLTVKRNYLMTFWQHKIVSGPRDCPMMLSKTAGFFPGTLSGSCLLRTLRPEIGLLDLVYIM